MASDWTELYRPDTLDEVHGNPKAVKDLRDWARRWEEGKPDKKAVVLMGPPGVGKTSAALALANEFGWGVVEMNASDQRNADAIKRIALRGALADTFTDDGEFLSSHHGYRKLIILDEADNIFGREDRGGIPAISDLIQKTKQPVILIVNDFYELKRRSSAIASQTKQIRFSKVKANTIGKVLGGIVQNEGLKISQRALDMIADNSNGDLRAAVRDLQSLSMGRKEVSEKDAATLQNRFVSKTMYDLMTEIFKGNDPLKARSMMMDVDETLDSVKLWVEENLPYEYKDPEELVKGMEALCRADLFLGRVIRRQYFGFWSYASDMLSFGVASSRDKPHRGYSRFRFPGYLIKMSRTKARRAVQSSISDKIGMKAHTSKSRAREDILPYLSWLFQKNRDFRIALSIDLDLEQEEMAFLLGEKVDSPTVKHLIAEIAKVKDVTERGEITRPIDEPSPPQEQRPEPSDVRSQRNLFEF
ncbi:MAG: replication factor C large subunit [Methanomassiliicoccales archaeon]|nr:replication factor C large subunit [Methanomassiliicoccales archaeon]NYT15834.1 replication factor C large subunit [Methanomassiliicoccales archaeon]